MTENNCGAEKYGGEVQKTPPPSKKKKIGKKKATQSTKLVELCSEVEFFHDAEGVAYATVISNSHKENWPLNSRRFRDWLSQLFFVATKTVPSSQALQDALAVLAGKAKFEGPEHRVFVRLAEHEGAIYIDLANENWEVVQIRPTGWLVISDPPVKFRRPRGMLAIPHPAHGGSIAELRNLVNVASQSDFRLVVGFLLGALKPNGPHPVLVLYGTHGSSKSTLPKMLRSLVDPNTAPLRTAPRGTDDLMIAAKNSWLLVFDNISRLGPELSDNLCRLATGGGFAKRELYQDEEEVLFNAQRPIILNGIEEFVTRSDLADRAIILHQPTIPEHDGRRKITGTRHRWSLLGFSALF